MVTNRVITVAGDQPTPLTLFATDSNGDYLTLWTKSPPLHGSTGDWDAVHGTLTYCRPAGYHGMDRFTYQASDGMTNSQVATVVVNVTAPPDSNSNGLPDTGKPPTGSPTPTRMPTWTDRTISRSISRAPTRPTRRRCCSITDVSWPTEEPFRLTWSSVGGTRYRVQYSTGDPGNGVSGPFMDIVRDAAVEIDDSPYGEPSTQSFTLSSTNAARYYRIQVVP